MENIEQPKPEYPLLLKMLFAVGLLFFGSLAILLLSLLLNMMGFAYGISNLLTLTAVMEQTGILMLGSSVLLGGAVSMVGLTTKSFMPANEMANQLEKQKNENQLYDIRDYGLTVEDVLGDMSHHERELLAEKLAESRLAIREDGTLIPLEQAEKLNKVERFIDG